jgi:hypothetical protein
MPTRHPVDPQIFRTILKVHLPENFGLWFFHLTNPLVPLIHSLNYFLTNSDSPRYSNSNHSLYYQYTQKEICVSSWSKMINYSWRVLGHVANMRTVFSKKCPYKSWKENNLIPNIQFLGGARNFTVCMLIIYRYWIKILLFTVIHEMKF